MEQTSPKVLQCVCGLWLYIFFFLFFLNVIPLSMKYMLQEVLPLPKVTHTPTRRTLSPLPESSLGRWQCCFCVNCVLHLFKKSSALVLLFVFRFCMVSYCGLHFFVLQLDVWRLWSPWVWVEVMRQAGLSFTLTCDHLNKSVHVINKHILFILNYVDSVS